MTMSVITGMKVGLKKSRGSGAIQEMAGILIDGEPYAYKEEDGKTIKLGIDITDLLTSMGYDPKKTIVEIHDHICSFEIYGYGGVKGWAKSYYDIETHKAYIKLYWINPVGGGISEIDAGAVIEDLELTVTIISNMGVTIEELYP